MNEKKEQQLRATAPEKVTLEGISDANIKGLTLAQKLLSKLEGSEDVLA